jgi:hypothetical protein
MLILPENSPIPAKCYTIMGWAAPVKHVEKIGTLLYFKSGNGEASLFFRDIITCSYLG